MSHYNGIVGDKKREKKIIKTFFTYFKKAFCSVCVFPFSFSRIFNMYTQQSRVTTTTGKRMVFGRRRIGMRGWWMDVSNIIVCRNIKSVLVLLFYFFTVYFSLSLPLSYC